MDAFILETLTSTGWRRGGETYWTLGSAQEAGRRLIRRKLARRVRIMPVQVGLQAVAELPKLVTAIPAKSATQIVRELDVEEIRQRLSELDKEGQALRVLLRAALRIKRQPGKEAEPAR